MNLSARLFTFMTSFFQKLATIIPILFLDLSLPINQNLNTQSVKFNFLFYYPVSFIFFSPLHAHKIDPPNHGVYYFH